MKRALWAATRSDKVSLLMDHTPSAAGDVADPWYTGDFEATWKDVTEGCQGLLQYILEENGKASKK